MVQRERKQMLLVQTRRLPKSQETRLLLKMRPKKRKEKVWVKWKEQLRWTKRQQRKQWTYEVAEVTSGGDKCRQVVWQVIG